MAQVNGLEGVFLDVRGSLEVGQGVRVSATPARSHIVVAQGALVRLGDDVRIAHGASISAQVRIEIGRATRIGAFATILDSDFHRVGDHRAAGKAGLIEIGENVLMGAHVTVLRGAKIGAGAVVAPGSVVRSPIEPHAHVSGVPANGSSGAAGVRAVVQRVLGLPALPAISEGPSHYEQWSSLGSLQILLALEQAFAVTLPEDRVALARSIADLERIVEQARMQASGRAEAPAR